MTKDTRPYQEQLGHNFGNIDLNGALAIEPEVRSYKGDVLDDPPTAM